MRIVRVVLPALLASAALAPTASAAGQQASRPLPAPAVETVITMENTSLAPKPTRIISLRPGVNWTETTGGK